MLKILTLKLYLKHKLFGLKMQEGSDLAEHINVFNKLIANFGKDDVKIDDEDRAIILLRSFPGSYEHLVTTLTYGKEDVKVDEIITALLGHEQRRKNSLSEDSSGGAFVVRGDHNGEDKKGSRKKGLQCYKCKG
jgi:cell division cycle protein 20 (cofactor of APC complex)